MCGVVVDVFGLCVGFLLFATECAKLTCGDLQCDYVNIVYGWQVPAHVEAYVDNNTRLADLLLPVQQIFQQ